MHPHILVLLNQYAEKLLDAATKISDQLELGPEQVISSSKRQELLKVLKVLCADLGEVSKLLALEGSPLSDLVRRESGVETCAPLSRIEEFISSHKIVLSIFGLKDPLLEQTLDTLRVIVDHGGDVPFDEAQPPIKANSVRDAIDQFRDVVCKIANAGEVANDFIQMTDTLRTIVNGVVGVALVVVDITGATTVGLHDLTFQVVFHAVRSTLSGVSMVKKATGKLKEMWDSFSAQRVRKNLQRHARNSKNSRNGS